MDDVQPDTPSDGAVEGKEKEDMTESPEEQTYRYIPRDLGSYIPEMECTCGIIG